MKEKLKLFREGQEIQMRKEIKELYMVPTMAIFSVGEDMASEVYIGKKKTFLKKHGIHTDHFHYSDKITIQQLMECIAGCDSDGIMLQLPLPNSFKKLEQEIIDCIPECKDVDRLTTMAKGMLMNGDISILPCTVQSCIDIMVNEEGNLEGRDVLIFGRSQLVGLPLNLALIHMNANPLIVHSKTGVNAEAMTNKYKANIIVSAVGQENFLNEWSVDGDNKLIIDVGINRNSEGKLCGDYETPVGNYHRYTPVPGGVGPFTVLNVGRNLLKLAQRKEKNCDLTRF